MGWEQSTHSIPNLLIPDPSRSFQQGCIELLGKWKDLGRWRRHIYKGVADTIERERTARTRNAAGNGLGRPAEEHPGYLAVRHR